MIAALLAVTFVELHGPSGQVLEVNPELITSLREPIAVARHHWAKGTRCIAVMTNGNFIALAEDCPTVLQKLGHDPPTR